MARVSNQQTLREAKRTLAQAIRGASRQVPPTWLEFHTVQTPEGPRQIPVCRPAFPRWKGGPLPSVELARVGAKTELVVGRERAYGELAVLRMLQRLGWDGVWVSTYGSFKGFWTGIPATSTRLPSLPRPAQMTYDEIRAERGGREGGHWDVFAWKRERFLYAECKEPGTGDKLNPNQKAWLPVAQRVVPSAIFMLVEWRAI
jgi:hypothetical protein